MKFKTLREGEKAVVFNHLGQGKVIVGPQRVFLFRETFNRLPVFTADRYEFVEIHENNGTIVHKPGPCQVFGNPLESTSWYVNRAHLLDSNHLLVVYRRIKNGGTERRIIQGPAVFILEADEWVHEFKWHGTDPNDKTRLVPGLDQFIQLPTIPSNVYYNVREVRTSDDTLLTVKVMLFYRMEDVLKMLDTTQDPVADLINALCADVISFIAPLTYEKFVEKTSQLSSLDTYPQLMQRAERVGFKVEKVVYRGYHASDKLQEMQNSTIESRTWLRLQREIEDQMLKLTNFKLNKQQERSSFEQSLDAKKQAHNQKIAELRQKHQLELQEMKQRHKLELASRKAQLNLETKEAEYQHKVNHLTTLAQVKVDLTKYLTTEYDTVPCEEIRVTAPVEKSELITHVG